MRLRRRGHERYYGRRGDVDRERERELELYVAA